MCNYRGRNVLRKTSIALAKKATKSYTRTKTKGDKPVNIEKKKTSETVRANKMRKGPRECNYSGGGNSCPLPFKDLEPFIATKK